MGLTHREVYSLDEDVYTLRKQRVPATFTVTDTDNDTFIYKRTSWCVTSTFVLSRADIKAYVLSALVDQEEQSKQDDHKDEDKELTAQKYVPYYRDYLLQVGLLFKARHKSEVFAIWSIIIVSIILKILLCLNCYQNWDAMTNNFATMYEMMKTTLQQPLSEWYPFVVAENQTVNHSYLSVAPLQALWLWFIATILAKIYPPMFVTGTSPDNEIIRTIMQLVLLFSDLVIFIPAVFFVMRQVSLYLTVYRQTQPILITQQPTATTTTTTTPGIATNKTKIDLTFKNFFVSKYVLIITALLAFQPLLIAYCYNLFSFTNVGLGLLLMAIGYAMKHDIIKTRVLLVLAALFDITNTVCFIATEFYLFGTLLRPSRRNTVFSAKIKNNNNRSKKIDNTSTLNDPYLYPVDTSSGTERPDSCGPSMNLLLMIIGGQNLITIPLLLFLSPFFIATLDLVNNGTTSATLSRGLTTIVDFVRDVCYDPKNIKTLSNTFVAQIWTIFEILKSISNSTYFTPTILSTTKTLFQAAYRGDKQLVQFPISAIIDKSIVVATAGATDGDDVSTTTAAAVSATATLVYNNESNIITQFVQEYTPIFITPIVTFFTTTFQSTVTLLGDWGVAPIVVVLFAFALVCLIPGLIKLFFCPTKQQFLTMLALSTLTVYIMELFLFNIQNLQVLFIFMNTLLLAFPQYPMFTVIFLVLTNTTQLFAFYANKQQLATYVMIQLGVLLLVPNYVQGEDNGIPQRSILQTIWYIIVIIISALVHWATLLPAEHINTTFQGLSIDVIQRFQQLIIIYYQYVFFVLLWCYLMIKQVF